MTRKTTDKSGAADAHPPQGTELYHDMPSVTPRQWGTPDAADDSFGQPGLGGPAAAAHDPVGAAGKGSTGQDEFAEGQGRHAQSGHGRGGSAGAHGRDGANVSRGTGAGGNAKDAASGRDEATRPDDSLRDDIIDRMTRDNELDASQILVMVEGGLVTLTGEVPEQSMKQRAQHTVEEASGARGIVNRITFDDGSASFGPLGEAVRSGNDQQGSGFSSSARIPGRD